MHELSIAYSLVEAAGHAAQQAGAARVAAVFLRLGPLSGVVQDALLFCYDIATRSTLLEGSRLVIENVPVIIYCESCGREYELPSIQNFRCPACGEPTRHIRQGRELEIVGLEIETAEAAAREAQIDASG